MTTHFADRLTTAVLRRRTPAVVGLDPVVENLPPPLRPAGRTTTDAARAFEAFCRGVIDVVAPLVPAVKINSGFFEALQAAGVEVYYRLVAHAHRCGLLVIGDIKRGDIGSTARQYAAGHFDAGFEDVDPLSIPDAVTLAGYLGENAVRPFIDLCLSSGRGVYVLVRPSEPKADEVHDFGGDDGRFYEHMARLVDRWGNAPELFGTSRLSCVGAVVAPKDPQSTAALRAALPHTPFLVPGYGAQGGTAEECRPCFRPDGTGAVVNASRSVIYAYQQPAFEEQFGDDWQAAVGAACASFAADVGRLLP